MRGGPLLGPYDSEKPTIIRLIRVFLRSGLMYDSIIGQTKQLKKVNSHTEEYDAQK